jgi:hypothetical protein
MRAAILLLYLSSVLALAEPLRLSPAGCTSYAEDAQQIALLRDVGTEESVVTADYAAQPYHPEVKPHLANLIHFVYASSLTPDEVQATLYKACLQNEGWIGKDF